MPTIRCTLPRRLPGQLLFALALGLLAPVCDAAPATEPKIAVTVEKSGEAFIVDAAIDVHVPLKTAWEVMTDFEHMATILSNLTLSQLTRRDGNTLTVRQEGVAKYGLLSFSFESEREMRLEPMRRILARNISGTLKRMESEVNFSPLEKGVQIRYHAEIVPDSLLARLFGLSFVQHEAEEQLLAMAQEMLRRNAGAEPAGKASAPQVR